MYSYAAHPSFFALEITKTLLTLLLTIPTARLMSCPLADCHHRLDTKS